MSKEYNNLNFKLFSHSLLEPLLLQWKVFKIMGAGEWKQPPVERFYRKKNKRYLIGRNFVGRNFRRAKLFVGRNFRH